jgi:hypothetical protein
MSLEQVGKAGEGAHVLAGHGLASLLGRPLTGRAPELDRLEGELDGAAAHDAMAVDRGIVAIGTQVPARGLHRLFLAVPRETEGTPADFLALGLAHW